MTTRKEIELHVTATNVHLRETVENMDILILLRNLHPTLRSDYARKLHQEEVITEAQMREFTVQQK